MIMKCFDLMKCFHLIENPMIESDPLYDLWFLISRSVGCTLTPPPFVISIQRYAV